MLKWRLKSVPEVTSLKHYSPGSIIRWPFGACGTLDFSSAMTCLTQQLSGGESRGYWGVIFKVRRLLTAKEVDESNRQVPWLERWLGDGWMESVSDGWRFPVARCDSWKGWEDDIGP